MTKPVKNKRLRRLLPALLGGLLLFAAAALHEAALFLAQTYNMSFDALVYTLTSPLKGAGGNAVPRGLAFALPGVLLALGSYILLTFFSWQSRVTVRLRLGGRRLDLLKWLRWALPPLSAALLAAACLFCDRTLGITDWVQSRSHQTHIYEEFYVDPLSVPLQADGTPKNLICIYLESMETTYASTDVGGAQPVNYIPNLTELALSPENVSFSDTKKLGGFHMAGGTAWTMAALFATTSGLPYSFPVEGNSMGLYQSFASGVTALGDLLAERGYIQEFLCGSDGAFAGRAQYFSQHGGYEIYDYFTAVERGAIPEGYFTWWGFEDSILYRIARDEILRLAGSGKPFNLTFLTADQHHTGGYLCPLCGGEYEEPLANVLRCGDRQLMEFIDWCRQQPFYEDTLIVIMGDHPRMDTCLVEGVGYGRRTVYNCFLNAQAVPEQTQERIFTSQDLFPTILRAMGFSIQGDRLGLGTDLFSGRPTLAEELGLANYQKELSGYSDFYLKTFS